MVVGDKAAGMVGSIAEVFPDAKYQRCTVHFYRNALAKAPKFKRSLMLVAHPAVKYVADSEWGPGVVWTRPCSRGSRTDDWLNLRKTIDGTSWSDSPLTGIPPRGPISRRRA